MMGMEKMLASMIGISPDQMAAISQQMVAAIIEGTASIKRIEEKQDLILAQLEVLHNGRGNIGSESDIDRNPVRGTRRNSRGTGRSGTVIDGATGAVIE